MKHTILIAILLLCGCAPYMTYDEMGEALRVAETEEEKKELVKKIEVFENNAYKAEAYFDSRRACEVTDGVMWFCDNVQPFKLDRVKNLDLDGLVRVYKKEHHACGCYNSDEVMRSMREAFGY